MDWTKLPLMIVIILVGTVLVAVVGGSLVGLIAAASARKDEQRAAARRGASAPSPETLSPSGEDAGGLRGPRDEPPGPAPGRRLRPAATDGKAPALREPPGPAAKGLPYV